MRALHLGKCRYINIDQIVEIWRAEYAGDSWHVEARFSDGSIGTLATFRATEKGLSPSLEAELFIEKIIHWGTQ